MDGDLPRVLKSIVEECEEDEEEEVEEEEEEEEASGIDAKQKMEGEGGTRRVLKEETEG